MGADDISSLLMKLQATPGDHETRKRAAEALDASGRQDEALAVLAPLVNLTGHDEDAGLPCLCKRCLPAAPASCEAEAMRFARSFAVVGTRVLHFWMLAEQERETVRASVTEALALRLAVVNAERRTKRRRWGA